MNNLPEYKAKQLPGRLGNEQLSGMRQSANLQRQTSLWMVHQLQGQTTDSHIQTGFRLIVSYEANQLTHKPGHAQ